ncbi:MAG: hypothetical protein ACR2PS_13210, partial [Pseudomonadales bacterium]
MIFAEFPLDQAEDVILAHTLKLPSVSFKKGLALTPEHIAILEKAGINRVRGARLEKGDLSEDEAARLVAEALAGDELTLGKARTGRCNLYAKRHGLTTIDAQRINAINSLGGSITIATLPDRGEALADQAVSTIKVIPFAVPRSEVETCLELARQNT